jgi:murein DD-endopeptidase MepM/ murein hydrolase activator NlpD
MKLLYRSNCKRNANIIFCLLSTTYTIKTKSSVKLLADPAKIRIDMRGFILLLLGLSMLLPSASLCAGEVYKYKDANGKWRFTDKKPAAADTKAETLSIKKTASKKVMPKFHTTKDKTKGKNHLVVTNPFHAPIQLELSSPQVQRKSRVIPPLGKRTLVSSAGAIEPFTYKWQLGDPNKALGPQEYYLPADPLGCYRISQSFDGQFSHQNDYNRYAVDIALPVGTPIKAARAGTVIAVKDDYYMGGVDKFFLDKANYVRILHDDSTFALYGHILLGTAAVSVGDKVAVGTTLARSGSSGYSSGPHLHFVIHKNSGLKMRSVAFEFISGRNRHFVPAAGQRLCDL